MTLKTKELQKFVGLFNTLLIFYKIFKESNLFKLIQEKIMDEKSGCFPKMLHSDFGLWTIKRKAGLILLIALFHPKR